MKPRGLVSLEKLESSHRRVVCRRVEVCTRGRAAGLGSEAGLIYIQPTSILNNPLRYNTSAYRVYLAEA